MKPTEPFVHRRQVSWGDTDAARIVYTARIPHFALEAIEAWFIDRLGLGFYDMNLEGFGTPFVHLEVDFKGRMTPADRLATRVLLDRAGHSSLAFALRSETEADGRLCWTGRFVCACVRTDIYAPIEIPERFRATVARELELAKAA